MNRELQDKIVFLLEQIADQDTNWDFVTDYGPYGRFTINEWVGGEYIWDTAQDILDELKKEKEEN